MTPQSDRVVSKFRSVQGVPTIKVWDPIVRIFHWTVVAGCLLNLFILDDGKMAHRVIGYIVAGALVVRIIWGFVGTRYARFADFVPGPRRLRSYLAALSKGREPRMLGHNPAGAVMMLMLMMLLAATCATGWMMGLDTFWGEEWLEATHAFLANAILVMATLHAGAALIESGRHDEGRIVSGPIVGHERNDETDVYPRLLEFLADRHGLGAMSRAHREILHQSRLLGRITYGLDPAHVDFYLVRDAQRVMESIEALVRLHNAQEEEIFEHVAAKE